MHKFRAFLFIFVSLLISSTCLAYIPQPESEGKFFPGKGTKSSESYESNAGMPIYDYAKGIQWGPLHLKPSVDYGFHWTDNVFLDEDNLKSDYVNRLYAGLDAELPLGGGQHLLSGGYRVHQEWFERFSAQNHTDHRGNVGLKLNFVRFTLDADDTYERTVSRADTEFTTRVQRDENAFRSLVEVPFASFFLENEITDFDVSYSSGANQIFDHNLFTVYQRAGYDLGPNTQVLAEYAFINIAYDADTLGNRDGDGHQYTLGIRGKFTERIAYQFWGGGQDRVYDEDTRPDFHGFIFRSAVQWDSSETNRFIVKGDRTPQESTFDNQSYYTRNRVEMSWRRQLAERWFFNSHVLAAYHEYSRITVVPVATSPQEITRRDHSWDTGFGIEYMMPNDIVSLSLDYRFSNRDSNLNGLDYAANEITAGVRAYF